MHLYRYESFLIEIVSEIFAKWITRKIKYDLMMTLGDCGYPLHTWLLTPAFSRSVSRWTDHRADHKTLAWTTSIGGALLYTPQKACRIVLVCSVQHNMANLQHTLKIVHYGVREHALVYTEINVNISISLQVCPNNYNFEFNIFFHLSV